MLRWLRRLTGNSEQKANGLAALIASSAIGFLYFEAPPTPAGANSVRMAGQRSSLKLDHARPVQALASIVEPAPISPGTESLSPEEQSVQTLRRKMELLQQGGKFLETIPDYTATFCKQELVDGELLEEQEIYLKCRHQPFSIYLKWLSGDSGREVIYVDGLNEGEMIVHAGGWKARLPALSISPNSSLALKEARYPVTNAGLLNLVRTILKVHEADLGKKNIARCDQLPDEEFDNRPCAVFVVEYKDKTSSPVYRKSVVLIDKEWNIPLYTRNFGWPDRAEHETATELDDATLIEYYTFSDVQLRQQLAELDFDRNNEDYRFR